MGFAVVIRCVGGVSARAHLLLTARCTAARPCSQLDDRPGPHIIIPLPLRRCARPATTDVMTLCLLSPRLLVLRPRCSLPMPSPVRLPFACCTRGLGELVVGSPRSLSWTISLLTPSRRMSYHTVYIHQPIHIVFPIVIGPLSISVSCRVYCVGRLGRDVQYHLLHLIPFVCTLTDLTQLTKRAC